MGEGRKDEFKENSFENILDSLSCGVLVCLFDGESIEYEYCNARYWEILGKTPSDYVGTSMLERVKDEDVFVFLEEIRSAIWDRRDVSCNIQMLCSGAGYRAIHLEGNVTNCENGKHRLRFTCTKAEQKVMSFQEMLPIALYNMMSVSSEAAFSFFKDKNMRYVSCSKYGIEKFGFKSPMDIVGKSDYDLFPKEIAETFEQAGRHVMETGESVVNEEMSLPSADSSIHIFENSIYPLRDFEDNIIGIYGAGRDVTEQTSREFQIQLLTQGIPGGLTSYYVENGKMVKVFLNDGFYKLFGFSADEFERFSEEEQLKFIYEDDLPVFSALSRRIVTELDTEKIEDVELRIVNKQGDIRWINIKSQLTRINDRQFLLNSVLLDITSQKDMEENLKIMEEEYRLAAQHSGRTIGRYSIDTQTLTIISDPENSIGLPFEIESVPYGQVRKGMVSSNTLDRYVDFFEGIIHGEMDQTVTFQRKLRNGWRWLNAHETTLFSATGKPVAALISYVDVTEQYEKDAIYRKWTQSLQDKSDDSYSLFCCYLNQEPSFISKEGSLIKFNYNDVSKMKYEDAVSAFADVRVYEQDRDSYQENLNKSKLIREFRGGKKRIAFEFREIVNADTYRWLRLSIDLIERPDSIGIMGYYMYENIDESKKAELTTQTLAETDPLTGLLNRKAFKERLNIRLKEREANSLFAFLILDLDGFKNVNDTLGHATGDQVLIETANIIRSALMNGDLVGRLGGDEFVVSICNVPNKGIIRKKARRIWQLLHREITPEVKVSCSMGIAVCPEDGSEFDILYKEADKVLYQIKESGKDNYGFYRKNV